MAYYVRGGSCWQNEYYPKWIQLVQVHASAMITPKRAGQAASKENVWQNLPIVENGESNLQCENAGECQWGDVFRCPSTYPCQSAGQWVSQSLIVSDLELAIGSLCFASLFSFFKHSSWLNVVMLFPSSYILVTWWLRANVYGFKFDNIWEHDYTVLGNVVTSVLTSFWIWGVMWTILNIRCYVNNNSNCEDARESFVDSPYR